MGCIGLRPLGAVERWLLDELKARIEEVFSRLVRIGATLALPEFAYNARRRQFESTPILRSLADVREEDEEAVLGVVDADLYVPHLNFVFGEADPFARAAIIGLARLRQGFYGLLEDWALLVTRATKEAIHELGHVYRLGHCRNPHCVMYFSNTLADTDRKEATFCSDCQAKLPRPKAG